MTSLLNKQPDASRRPLQFVFSYAHTYTIQDADKIVVLEGKHIKELGTHSELIALDGLYKRLYSVQKQLEPVGRG